MFIPNLKVVHTLVVLSLYTPVAVLTHKLWVTTVLLQSTTMEVENSTDDR